MMNRQRKLTLFTVLLLVGVLWTSNATAWYIQRTSGSITYFTPENLTGSSETVITSSSWLGQAAGALGNATNFSAFDGSTWYQGTTNGAYDFTSDMDEASKVVAEHVVVDSDPCDPASAGTVGFCWGMVNVVTIKANPSSSYGAYCGLRGQAKWELEVRQTGEATIMNYAELQVQGMTHWDEVVYNNGDYYKSWYALLNWGLFQPYTPWSNFDVTYVDHDLETITGDPIIFSLLQAGSATFNAAGWEMDTTMSTSGQAFIDNNGSSSSCGVTGNMLFTLHKNPAGDWCDD